METTTIRAWPEQVGAVATSARKRCLDVAAASLLVALLAPVLLLISLAIYIESGGPVLFRQTRAGLGGQLFTIFKFRSMTVSEGPTEWTKREDPRVTMVGAFLRRTSLDELPQLLNVIAGDMSLVGPRPHPTGLDAEYWHLINGYGDRLRTRPGITGLAQVRDLRGSISCADEMRMRVAADLDYIDNWSIGLDLAILARTIPHLLAAGNAY